MVFGACNILDGKVPLVWQVLSDWIQCKIPMLWVHCISNLTLGVNGGVILKSNANLTLGVNGGVILKSNANLTLGVNGVVILKSNANLTLGVNGVVILKSNAICLKSPHIGFPMFPKTAFPMTFPLLNPLQVPLKP